GGDLEGRLRLRLRQLPRWPLHPDPSPAGDRARTSDAHARTLARSFRAPRRRGFRAARRIRTTLEKRRAARGMEETESGLQRTALKRRSRRAFLYARWKPGRGAWRADWTAGVYRGQGGRMTIDKALQYYDRFDRRLRAELRRLVTDHVIAEHRANPLGRR